MTTDVPTRDAEPARGPVRAAERSLAPDLARGAMLLIIALAHAPGVFFNNAPGLDTTPHGMERFYNVFLFCFVHARGLPLFAIMFGYGLIQIARRQDAVADGPKAARNVLLRRHLWLLVFGFVHGILLFSGDILGAYGIVGIVFTLLLLRRGAWANRVAIGYVAFAALYVVTLGVIVTMGIVGNPNGSASVQTDPFRTVMGDNYLSSIMERLGEWPTGTVVFLPFILIVWVGTWAARRKLLEEPANNLGLLRTGAIGGLSIAILGGLPMGLLSGGFLHMDSGTAVWAKILYESAGLFGGIGYFCVFGLLSVAVTKRKAAPRENIIVGSLAALGQRSMSGYIFQSVAWLLLASSFTLSLDTKTDNPTFVSAGCAVAVWLLTVVIASLMQRASYRGPAEILLRRLTYGRSVSRGSKGSGVSNGPGVHRGSPRTEARGQAPIPERKVAPDGSVYRRL